VQWVVYWGHRHRVTDVFVVVAGVRTGSWGWVHSPESGSEQMYHTVSINTITLFPSAPRLLIVRRCCVARSTDAKSPELPRPALFRLVSQRDQSISRVLLVSPADRFDFIVSFDCQQVRLPVQHRQLHRRWETASLLVAEGVSRLWRQVRYYGRLELMARVILQGQQQLPRLLRSSLLRT
jgi:hypothetical protein